MSAIRFRVLPRNATESEGDKQRQAMNKWLMIALFMVPGLLVFFVFLLIPLVSSLDFSLYKWNGLGPPTDFVGINNYKTLLANGVFQQSLAHSFLLMTLSLLVQLPIALGLALLVGRGELRGRRFFRGVLFIPFVFSEIISAILWLYVLKPETGLLNMVLLSAIPGFKAVSWLADRSIVLYGIFAVITWKYFGFHMILYMAGLQGIPKDLEDAARVDGATEFNVLRHITLPMLGSTIRLTVYLSVLGSFQQFVIIEVMTLGGPVNASEVIASYLYKYGIKSFNLGYGSAVAVILFAITLVFSIGYQRIILRRDYSADVV